MKKTLLIAVPAALILLFLGIHAPQSYGFGSHRFSNRLAKRQEFKQDFLFYRLDRLGEKLQLTSEQKTELEALKKDLQGIMDDRWEQRDRFRENLSEQLSKDQLDTRAITSMLHSQIDDRARFSHQLVDRIGDFLSGLTPDQKKELSESILQKWQQ